MGNWNNHHHLLHTVRHVSGGMLWANLHLLFWLSLVPFTTRWMGDNHFAPLPTAVYGAVLLLDRVATRSSSGGPCEAGFWGGRSNPDRAFGQGNSD